MSRTLEQMVEDLSALDMLKMSKLKKMLEETWGVKAAVMSAGAPAGEAAVVPAAAEASEFQVTLEKVPDDKKIGVIQALRKIPNLDPAEPTLGLKKAKDLVEGAPKMLKPNCSKAEADEIVKIITAAGGQVTVKGV